jgi:uncharacterized protein YqeY
MRSMNSRAHSLWDVLREALMLRDVIQEKLKAAMKARDQATTDCIRMMVAAVKNKELEKRGELSDEECAKVLATLSKQRMESIGMYKQGGRQDLAEREEAELKIIRSFLPEQLPDSELEKIVDETIAELSAGKADMGKVMKALGPKVGGRADGKRMSDLVRQRLAKV